MASTHIPNSKPIEVPEASRGMLVLQLNCRLATFKYGSLKVDFSKDYVNQYKVAADTYVFQHDGIEFRVNTKNGEISITAEKNRLSKFFTKALFKRAYTKDLETGETTALRDLSHYAAIHQTDKHHQVLKPLTAFIKNDPTVVESLTHSKPVTRRYNDEQSIKEDLLEGLSLRRIRGRMHDLISLMEKTPNTVTRENFKAEEYSWLFKDPKYEKMNRYREHIRRLIKKLEKQDAIDFATQNGWTIKPHPASSGAAPRPAHESNLPVDNRPPEEIQLAGEPHEPLVFEAENIPEHETSFNGSGSGSGSDTETEQVPPRQQARTQRQERLRRQQQPNTGRQKQPNGPLPIITTPPVVATPPAQQVQQPTVQPQPRVQKPTVQPQVQAQAQAQAQAQQNTPKRTRVRRLSAHSNRQPNQKQRRGDGSNLPQHRQHLRQRPKQRSRATATTSPRLVNVGNSDND
ncbi:hypothetical protein [Parashewanella tropica]|uniref:hypothetical protein n=1 Tax=Parashewanella tropica TaxID=2547970 RepID=UPI00105AAE73|nr:hypothetical protein [Parashewanella tropica]